MIDPNNIAIIEKNSRKYTIASDRGISLECNHIVHTANHDQDTGNTGGKSNDQRYFVVDGGGDDDERQTGEELQHTTHSVFLFLEYTDSIGMSTTFVVLIIHKLKFFSIESDVRYLVQLR